MPVPLFVYGTLKRNTRGTPHRLLRGARFVEGGSVSGDLYDLGEYPGLIRMPRKRGRVFGELYELPAETAPRAFELLDSYEGSEFVRRRAHVTLNDGRRRVAWTYVLRKQPPRSARLVATGRYAPRRGAA